MEFYIGLHQPSDAQHFKYSFISVNRLVNRKSYFKVQNWIMDSGAFSQIYNKGEHLDTQLYANIINKFRSCGNLEAAVSQDYMCEEFILRRTGKTVREHQKMTIQKYLELVNITSVYIMPVIQGYEPEEYQQHVLMYGNLLKENMWVGVGSVCKRNSEPEKILDVLLAIREVRPDLKLHGFGVKITALKNGTIRNMFYTADSMAWSYHARKNGRNANDYREALRYKNMILQIKEEPAQASIYDYV